MARTVWVTPLPAKTKKESVRKLFYDAHCGVVLNVSIQDHKTKLSPAKAHYAFGMDFHKCLSLGIELILSLLVEFAHVNSVLLALDLSASGKVIVSF